MNLDDLSKPGLHCIIVRHDSWCPGARGDGNNCICNAVAEIVYEETMVEAIVQSNRAQRRAAARAAQRAKR